MVKLIVVVDRFRLRRRIRLLPFRVRFPIGQTAHVRGGVFVLNTVTRSRRRQQRAGVEILDRLRDTLRNVRAGSQPCKNQNARI